jgi:type VI secretion system protein ImpE
MDPKQLFEAGDLTKAIEAQISLVKTAPTDLARRAFLFELYAFVGDYERARKQLDFVKSMNAQSEWAVTVYGHLLEAEAKRRKFYEGGAPPEFLIDIPDHLQPHLEAVKQIAAGREGEATALLQAAAEQTPTVSGKLNEQPFTDIRDCDDLLAPVLEVMILNDYVWVPFTQIQSLEINPPERPRDLIWTPAKLLLTDGTTRSGYLPALYFGSAAHADNELKLGRATDWRCGEGAPVQGIGQHQLLVGEAEVGLLDIRKLEIAG